MTERAVEITKTVGCVALLWLFAAGANAQESPALRMTLEDAQSRALIASHRLAEARAREAAAQGAVALRQASDRPIVSLTAGYMRTNHVLPFAVPGVAGVPRVLYPDAPNNYRTRLDLQWPIYTAGRLDALERAASAEASAIAADINAAQGDLRLEVARVFWALVTARATVDVVEQAVRRAQAHVAEVRQRFNTGLVPPNEVALVEAQESRQRVLLIEARNQRDLSSAELARLTGIDLQQAIEPAATLDPTDAPPRFDTVVVEARNNRQERRGLELRIEAGQLQEAAIASSLRPGVSVAGGFDYAKPNPKIFPRTDIWQRSWDVSVNVAWSLWDGGRTQAEAAQAAASTDAVRERLAEFDSLLGLELRQRLLEIDSGREAISAADDGVRAATEARRVVAQRYQVGVATETEVLDADGALLLAELDRTRALAALKLANARLERARGR